MRYSPGHKEQTRARIVEAAGKVFRRLGYHAAGVDKVMEEAGLTAGGFYSHFASKDALLADVLARTAVEVGTPNAKRRERMTGRAGVEVFVERYLSSSHRRGKAEDGCPLPALVSEVARAGDPVKASFEAIVRDLAARLAGDTSVAADRDRALAILCLCVGGLGVARSVRDEAFGERILAACRELARDGLVTRAVEHASVMTSGRRKKA